MSLGQIVLPLSFVQSVLVRLHSMGLPRCATPLRLLQSNEEEEDFESLDNNEFLQQLSGTIIMSLHSCSILVNIVK